MADDIELDVPAHPEYLALVRLIVSAAASGESSFAPERIDDLRLAVSEATTNAMEAELRVAGEAGEARPVEVRCRLDNDRVVVEVSDHGGGFEPSDLVPHPPVNDPARLDHERGLGIPLIRLLSDEVDFTAGSSGTTVRMVFRADTLPGSLA